MWEVEKEKMAEPPRFKVPGEADVFDESIAILNAARKKLIGF